MNMIPGLSVDVLERIRLAGTQRCAASQDFAAISRQIRGLYRARACGRRIPNAADYADAEESKVEVVK